MSSCSSLRPPSSSLYPLVALDTFLQQQIRSASSNSDDSDGSGNDNKELTLRVADNLFGSSLLEGALTTLESCTITEIQAVISRRRMFIITKRQRQQHARQKPDEEPQKYFCLLPQQQQQCLPVQQLHNENGMQEEASTNDNTTDIGQCPPSSQWKGFFFCSCRAYFERTKSMSGGTPHSSVTVCKHLLALKLRPALLPSPSTTSTSGSQYQKIETATEEEFSQQVLKLLLAGSD